MWQSPRQWLFALGLGGYGLLLLVALLSWDQSIRTWQRPSAQGEVVLFFQSITHLGESMYYILPAALIWLGFTLAQRVGAPLSAVAQRWRRESGLLVVCVLGAGVLLNIVKPLFGRARPRLWWREEIEGFHWFALGSDYASFPSGHATTVFALAVFCWLCWRSWTLRLSVLSFACLIAASRVMTGSHYLSDVLAGALLGGGFSYYVMTRTRLPSSIRSLPATNRETAST